VGEPLHFLPILLSLQILASRPPANEPGPSPDQVRAAVTRGLPLLLKSAAQYTDHRQCFACHHQALPVLALTVAKSRGFDVADEDIQKQLEFTAESLDKGRAGYVKGKGQGGQADTAGYALFTLDVGGWDADDTTSAVAEYLLQRDADHGYWKTTSRRPPSEASPFTTTYLALRGLRQFATADQQERVADRSAKALRWLLANPAKDTEDRVFRLGALRLAGGDEKDVRAAAEDLRKTRRPDGGWSQTDELSSDAYATGSALVMLHQVGGLPTTDAAYRRGVKFLIGSQLPDGSWYVKSRSKPFQTYFESGFPHGKDQFISVAASGWATAALALAVPPPVAPKVRAFTGGVLF
jgi:hypothetical protein